jgi:uncharacterized protein YwgA
MDGRLVVLGRVAEALAEDVQISTFECRKRFQKAIYLAQTAGVDLGYRFGWYLKGPYSTALTRDYYSMAEALAGGDQISAQQQLKNEIRAKLAGILPLFTVPQGVPLNKADWMELLASWHYLRKVSRFDHEEARAFMQDRKSHLVPFIARANDQLAAFGII